MPPVSLRKQEKTAPGRAKHKDLFLVFSSTPFKVILYILLFISLYIFFPFYLASWLKNASLKTTLFFYLGNILFCFFMVKSHFNKRYALDHEIEKKQEELNILNEQKQHEAKSNMALRSKISRYNSLKKVVEDINESLDPETAANNFVNITFSLIANEKGNCMLYLVDNRAQKLSLFKSRKELEGAVIKEKEGDIFDYWVLRHASPLLVENTKKDFRFDPEKIKEDKTRPVSSLISSCLISEHRVLGLLRLDSPQVNFYSQDDLRFLVKICELGAVALENSELFQKQQELAIHDSLTGLFTKGYFLERLNEECRRARQSKSVLSLLMLDIDFFKNYNDKFGHTAGDIVLKELSRNIRRSTETLNPVVARFGGEEFCILLLGMDKTQAHATASKLCKGIEEKKIILRRQETNITVSIGLACFPLDASDETTLMQKSDSAMYEAKRKGRNQVCCI